MELYAFVNLKNGVFRIHVYQIFSENEPANSFGDMSVFVQFFFNETLF